MEPRIDHALYHQSMQRGPPPMACPRPPGNLTGPPPVGTQFRQPFPRSAMYQHPIRGAGVPLARQPMTGPTQPQQCLQQSLQCCCRCDHHTQHDKHQEEKPKPQPDKKYNTSLDLYENPRTISIETVTKCAGNDSQDYLSGTVHAVGEEGWFDECVHVTRQAYKELINLATHQRTSDKWTKESIEMYLKFTWIRLLEQNRILNAKALSKDDLLSSAGISRTFAVFNTGLVNEHGEDIYVVLVQTSSKSDEKFPPFTLFQSGITLLRGGIYIKGDKKKPFVEYLKTKLEDRSITDQFSVNGARDLDKMSGLLTKATFFQPRDQNLLLDWTADIQYNELHIIKERLDRFLEAGVIDEHEADMVDQPPQGEEKQFQSIEYKGQKRYIRKHGDDGQFYFRRQNFGATACSLLLKSWIEDAQQRVQGTFTLAVPQAYYQQTKLKIPPTSSDERETTVMIYRGRLQLLIPLFCGTNKAKLALSLDYKDGSYKANTVLKIQWAYSNARLLAAPQATWIIQDM